MLVDRLRQSEALGGLIWTPGDLVHSQEEEVHDILILGVERVHEGLQRPVPITALNLLHLSQLDVVNALADPLVPVHAVIGVELDAAKLHGEGLVVEDGVPREEVEIEGIDLEPVLEDDEGQSQLQDLVSFGHVFELSGAPLTFRYFSKGSRLMWSRSNFSYRRPVNSRSKAMNSTLVLAGVPWAAVCRLSSPPIRS